MQKYSYTDKMPTVHSEGISGGVVAPGKLWVLQDLVNE